MIEGGKVNKNLYNPPFNAHLLSMLKFYDSKDTEKMKNFHYSEQVYYGVEQKILEVLPSDQEYSNIQWDLVEEYRYMYKDALQRKMGFEGMSDFMKPFVLFSTNLFENWCVFEFMKMNQTNPWGGILSTILESGLIYFISDDRYVLKELDKDILKSAKDEYAGNLGVVAKPNNGKNKTSGFIVDNRHSSQILVRDFIQTNASGRENAINVEKIMNFLYSINRTPSLSEIKSNILIPLKREGLVGSSSKGYYYINSIDDIIDTYMHHFNSISGIVSTIASYKKKAVEFGIPDLDEMLAERGFFDLKKR